MQGFFEQGVLVLDWRLIARRYMRTWFLPDVVAVFPWEVAASEPQTFTSAHARTVRASPARSVRMRWLALQRVITAHGQLIKVSRLARLPKMLRTLSLINVAKRYCRQQHAERTSRRGNRDVARRYRKHFDVSLAVKDSIFFR
jgi:hypothetical protein